MSRPLTRAQVLQNRAFLAALRRTGNVRLACREVGVAHSTLQFRRSRHVRFAVAWDAALVVAQARLAKRYAKEGRHGSEGVAGPSTTFGGSPPRASSGRNGPSTTFGGSPPHRFATGRNNERLRTAGGEAVVVRLRNGTLQVRRAQKGKLTRAAEQGFLAALSATCNASLAAAAVGASFRAFDRRRKRDKAFAREWRVAIAEGWKALEAALLESGLADSHEHDDWRSNAPPAVPPMTASQALQLMYLHQKEALMLAEPSATKRRRGESADAHEGRMRALHEAWMERQREAFEVAEATRMARGEPASGPAGEAVREEWEERGWAPLPDLSQVTGWSRADPRKVAYRDGVALFGGWRREEMEEKERKGWSRE